MTVNGIELLAPAGKWDVLEAVASAGADAVYLGGKRFNMRMLKPDFNFSDEELRDAAAFLHEQDKKIYVTINNLYYENEIEQLRDYLSFLQEIAVDALIIQDIALIKIHQQMGLSLPLHASVQMGIGNAEAVNFMKSSGVERVILSKNLSWDEIKSIYETTGMDIEYFAHGDLCVSHTGQCYMSSFASGQGGNRGMCVKPCRWPYSLDGTSYGLQGEQYYLAYNDLCLFHCIKILRDAGVVSFKLEGRMRTADYLSHLVSCYRVAMDHLVESRSKDELDDAYKSIYERRIRDFTTGNLYSRPGLDAIDTSGTREPIFISTPFRLNRLASSDYPEITVPPSKKSSDLSVKIGSLEVVPGLLAAGVESIILGIEYMRQDSVAWTADSIRMAVDMARAAGVSVVVETPRIVTEADMSDIKKRLLEVRDIPVDAIIANDWGSLRLARESGLKVWGGYGLNITNSLAADYLRDYDIERVTLSLELNLGHMTAIAKSTAEDVEVLVHGPLCGMVTDVCVPRFCNGDEAGFCGTYCMFDNYSLVDPLEQRYRVRSDENCRNYIYYPYDLCLINQLPQLIEKGIQHFRIEGQYYNDELLLEIVKTYRKALDSTVETAERREYFEHLLALFPDGLTLNNASDYQIRD